MSDPKTQDMGPVEIEIEKIKINKRMRKVDQLKVNELKESIQELGLLQPITISKSNELIAGAHRLEAFKQLLKFKIPCIYLQSDNKLDIELAEIDENLIRSELNDIDRGDFLLRRKEIYEEKYPETKQGGDRKSEQIKSSKSRFENNSSFVKDTTEKLQNLGKKVSERTIERSIQIAKNLNSEQKEVLKEKELPKTELLELVRQKPEIKDKIIEKIKDLPKHDINNKIKITELAQEVKEEIKIETTEENRLMELDLIFEGYWNQDFDEIDALKNKFTNLGYNNYQIRKEIEYLNKLHIDGPIEEKKSSQTIYIKSSINMTEIIDNSVHVIITSPPYWNKKDYGNSNQIGFNQDFNEYLQQLFVVFKECSRVLIPGGRLCINIGDVFSSKEETGRYKVFPIHAYLLTELEKYDLDYTNTIIWRKIGTSNGSGGIKGGIFGSYPYPPNGVINNEIEYILTFKKTGIRDIVEKSILDKFEKDEWLLHFGQIWDIPSVSQKKGHPAIFPDEIPKRLIKMFSFHNEIILDPFVGSGTTCKVALELGRQSIGYEIQSKFVSLISEKCPSAKIIDEYNTIIRNGDI